MAGPRILRGWRPSLLVAAVAVNVLLATAIALVARPAGLRASVFPESAVPGTAPLYREVDADLSSLSVARLLGRAGRPDVIIRWDGVLYATESREYEIGVTGAGRVIVRVDGHMLVSHDGTGGSTNASARTTLRAGPHLIDIHMEQPAIQAGFALRRDQPGAHEPVPVPLVELSPSSLTDREWQRHRWVPDLVRAWLLAWAALVCLAGWRLMRGVLPTPDVFADARVRAAIALAAVLFLTGVWWGLPGPSWALDEIAPYEVHAGWARRFSGGWHDKYPPFHFFLLTLVQAPALVAHRFGFVDLKSAELDAALYIAQRLLSVAMGLGVLACLAVLADRVVGRRHAWLAILAAAGSMPLAYYAKTSNLDVPYVFWFMCSMVFYAEAVGGGRTRDLVAFGVTAALAVATKDQAYGLYAAPAIYLLWRQVVHRRPTPLLAGLAAAIVTFALAHNLPFNLAGFAGHVDDLLGPASQNYRMFPSTPDGQWALARTTASLLPWAFGWPGLAVCALGVALASRRASAVRIPGWLHLPALSYCLTFLAVIGYVYDRFLLPVVILLALATAVGLRRLLDGWPRPWIGRVTGGLVIGCLIWRAISVDALMAFDPRLAVESWLRAHVPAGATIARVQQPAYLPRLAEFRDVEMSATIDATHAVRPEFIVVNADYLRRYPPGTPRRVWLAWLEAADGPYVEVLRHRTPLVWSAFRWTKIFQDDVESPIINLDKLNAEFVVFQRRGSG